MARLQLSVLGQVVQSQGLGALRLGAVRSGTNDIAFRAVAVTLAGGEYQVADDAGKLRTFRDADDFLKQAGALGIVASTFRVDFSGLELVAPKPFTGDIIKKNENLIVSHQKRRATAVEKVATLTTEIALMAADPTVPESMKVERQAQKEAVDGLIAWLDAEVTRIQGLLGVEA